MRRGASGTDAGIVFRLVEVRPAEAVRLRAKLYTRDGRGYEPVDENHRVAGNEGVCGGDSLSPGQRES